MTAIAVSEHPLEAFVSQVPLLRGEPDHDLCKS